jgi:hypothetical protein
LAGAAVLSIVLIFLTVYCSVLFYFINSTIVAEGRGVLSAIARSVELSGNRKTNVFGAVTLSGLITTLAGAAVLLLLSYIESAFGGYGT